MTRFLAVAFAVIAAPVLASTAGDPFAPVVVPEIDALAGVAALAAVAGVVALIRERTKG